MPAPIDQTWAASHAGVLMSRETLAPHPRATADHLGWLAAWTPSMPLATPARSVAAAHPEMAPPARGA